VIDTSVAQNSSKKWLKDTKTHQHRRLTLDAQTVTLLRKHRETCDENAAKLKSKLGPDAFVFSLAPDSSEHLVPDRVSQRYSKLAARLGIDTHLHNLRHYSATELIAAGVDIRTVAGRFGHGGGGTTTLRVYTAFVPRLISKPRRHFSTGSRPSRNRSASANGSCAPRVHPTRRSPASLALPSSPAFYRRAPPRHPQKSLPSNMGCPRQPFAER
jgi:hypothetical protein